MIVCPYCKSNMERPGKQLNAEAVYILLTSSKPFSMCGHCLNFTSHKLRSGFKWDIPHRQRWFEKLVSCLETLGRVTAEVCIKLRNYGFKPYAKASFKEATPGKRWEFISYPYPESGRIFIKVRRVNKPWEMITAPLADFVPRLK